MTTAIGVLPRLEDAEDLRAEAAVAGAELEGAPAAEIFRWGLERFGSGLVITSSMADAVLVHLASTVSDGRKVPVIFLDTGYHFAETRGMADAVEATHPVRLLRITPVQSVAQQDAAYGPRLYERDPDLCCQLRKVDTLNSALTPFQAWASGIRREETPARAGVRVVEWDEARQKVKLNPIAAWTQDDVDRYIADNGVLVNPLLDDGYPSVGCAPCTHRVAPGEDARAGRWAGTDKNECGLHG